MRQLIREIRPDIVHTHTHVGASWGRTAAMLEKVPIIVHTEHRSVDSLPLLELIAHSIINRRTDVTVTFSERTAELVRHRESLDAVHIIPNGIRVRPAPPTESDRRAARAVLGFGEDLVVVGMIANLLPNKNPGLVIDAFARLTPEARGVARLAFFGDGPLRNDLLAQAARLGIQSFVQLYGFRADLEQVLPGLDLMVSTSAREMMPMSFLESMNAALPIIGAPHVGTLDLVRDGETGIILSSWDADALAAALDWAIERPDWRLRAGNAAYERLRRNFDIESVADRYVDLYRSLLHKRAANIVRAASPRQEAP